MAVVTRPDSPYYWINIERRGLPPLRESTKVRVDAPSAAQRAENRKLADDYYHLRRAEVVKQRVHGTTPRRKPRHPAGPCFVYFVRVGDGIKIGRSVAIMRRLEEFQTAHAGALSVLAAVPGDATCERALHGMFRHLRIRGEWFRADPELLALVDDVRRGASLPALLHARLESTGRIDALQHVANRQLNEQTQ